MRMQQSGVVLAVGLIVLLVMTLIGLSATRSTLLEERMSGHHTDTGIAFQAAEAALRIGEDSLQQAVLPEFDGSGGLFRAPEYVDPTQPPIWRQWQGPEEATNWWNQAIPYTAMSEAPSPLNQAGAHFYVEEFPLVYGPGESLAADTPVDDFGFYRITARAVGISGKASVILQSTYKR